jgi:DinB superfamily
MKRALAPFAVTLAILFALGCSVPARAQQLSQTDLSKALDLLESSKKDVLAATAGLSPAQWNFKAAPEKWSIAECMEHIAAAEDYIRGMIAEKLMLAPAAPDRDTAKIDAAIIANVEDRSHKAQAPEPIKPTNRFGSPQGSIDHFLKSRGETESFLKDTPGLRDHAVDNPSGQGPKWDAYEFILLIGAHSERHTKQILEIKADPNYPQS